MAALTVDIDPITERKLMQISRVSGESPDRSAARLLARAVRDSRVRRRFYSVDIKRINAEFAEEDLTLAESGIEERASLLADEDRL